MFVLSLATFLYSYAVRYERMSAPASASAVVADVLLFSGFALHHSILARSAAKRWVVRWVPAALERSSFTWISSLLFIVVCLVWQPAGGWMYRAEGVWRVAGYAAQAAGIWLTIAGSRALDVLDLAGIRAVLNARHGRLPRHTPLETRGVYGLVRHPVYFGWVLFVFGVPDMNGTRLLFAVISTAYLVAAIPFEERSLAGVFGEVYARYRAAVRWRLIPGLW
jgi:protein-S-isoprenylcysteine O-methyltransferase Ste14